VPESPDVTQLEAQAVAGQSRRSLEHGRRAVEAERLGSSQAAVELHGQLPVATPQVDHPAPGHGTHEREQVEEGLGPLGGEAPVPPRRPGVHCVIVHCVI
jgi:hypothetical protein